MSDELTVSAADVARMANVGRTAVSNWRRRHPDFPQPVDSTDPNPRFKVAEVQNWLVDQGKLTEVAPLDALWGAVDGGRADAELAEILGQAAGYLLDPRDGHDLSEAARSILDGVPAKSRPEFVEQISTRYFGRQQRTHLMTPHELAGLMVEIADSRGTVLDPACGAGNILREAAEHGAARLVGQEINESLIPFTRARLGFSDRKSKVSVRIEAGDALRNDAFPDLRADAVICDPPFGYRDWGYEELGVDARWEYGFPVKSEPELAWMQHCLAHTRTGGTAVMLAPAGVASRRSGKVVRQAMVRRGVVRAVIALPPGLLMSTGIPLHLWVLHAPSGESVAPVLLLDVSDHKPRRRGQVDWEAVREAVLGPWQTFAASGKVDEIPGVQTTIEAIDLLDEDVDLTPARHLPPPALDIDAVRLDATRAKLAHTLAALAGVLPEVKKRDRIEHSTTTISELARVGALEVRQHAGRLELTDEPDASGPLVLTGHNVAAGTEPHMHLLAEPRSELIDLLPGDVVVPALDATNGPSAALVVAKEGLLLGPNLHLIRVDPLRLDADFLAGHLRSSRASRTGSATASGVQRMDVRRVEIPMLDLDEQKRQGELFRQVHEFELGLREAAIAGGQLATQLNDGLAEGALSFPSTTNRN